MQIRDICFISLLFLLVLIGLLAFQSGGPHDFEGKCEFCHVGLKDPAILTKEPNRLCLSCHPDSEKLSHPSNFYPVESLPAPFPLFRNKLVCVTCHFPHRTYGQEALNETPKVKGPFLLRAEEAGKLFCFRCHKGDFVDFQVDSHALAGKKAHKPPLDYELKNTMDVNSRECLSCHDGTLSISSDAELRELNWEHHTEIGLSHPVGVDYMDVYSRNPDTYHEPDGLDPRIVLINGKVECETCHNHYSSFKKKLVMENWGSRLCLSCHNL